MDTQGKFYLGKLFDPKAGALSDQPLLYDPADLTTHAVVVGMTGSGKTGLCIDLLEEAALNSVPALMIDPKGDITNALLHFPELSPADFQPWVNADQARRDGITIEQASSNAAAQWQKGLAEWGMGADRLRALKDAAQFAVYTPGSDSGIPVSILASLKTPDIPWENNRELLREKISSTVIALLGLVGLQDIDPVRSREHILLANIFEHAWSQGLDLDLGELIMQTQNPPFEKLGVFDVNTFFPEKDRFALAMLLNNILAAPAFQVWIEGQPLDINSLLYAPDGRPRHSVFYIAHLNDSERMFFVTLLYSAVEAWMRSQPGTQSLRLILYFDEIFGYMPPVGNPPPKQPMLRMLKQARAFGVGQVLVTQNPVDMDYKALSNAGSWFIGKLQTERDKERLLDGLESAMAGGLDRRVYDRMISALGKRVFLLHNVHEKQPVLFQTRWAMNYLAGPLTRAQIPAVNQLAGASGGATQVAQTTAAPTGAPVVAAGAAAPAVTAAEKRQDVQPQPDLGSATRPAVPSGIVEYFLPNTLSFTQAFKSTGQAYPPEANSLGLHYRPALLAQADIRFVNRKYNLDYALLLAALVPDPDRRGSLRWDDYQTQAMQRNSLDSAPDPRARFAPLDAPLNDAKTMTSLRRSFEDWAYRSAEVQVRANEELGVYAGPEVSQSEFRKLCSEAARQGRDAELEKVGASFQTKLDRLEDRLSAEERELREDESEYSQRKLEEYGTHAENLLGLFGGRKRRLSTSLSKRRMTEKAKADIEESQDAIQQYKKDLADLEKEKAQALEEVNEKWSDIVDDVVEISVNPFKKDILVDLFGVAWLPYYVVQVGNEVIELPGYGEAEV
jgi:hypothetical protein